MNRFNIWTAVQVKNEEHDRAMQAGVVHGVDPAKPNDVAVKFDADGVVLVVAADDLRAL